MSPRYRAFISYSHADERWAAWLQRSIEHYRVPGRLRATHPDLPRRLNPVFRDKDELASSTDLGDSIRSAMERSDALVVVCSPAAAASRWVNEEIRVFRELAPGKDILCLMVEGGADADAGDCAFPPALLTDADGHSLPEPLAADVRPQADGKRGAFLKLTAGLLGVGIDALRQREQQRKVRFMSMVTGGALVIAAITIGLAINAYKARQESELRRDQAEELIGFMLGDLRGKLQPIGKLDILDAVGDQAMDYFAALGDELTGEDALARVMALRQIGEVRFQQGQLGPALEAFGQSRDFAQLLHRSEPAIDQFLFELGQAEFWVGYVAWKQSRLLDAEQSMTRYMDHTQALLQRSPDNESYRLELAYSYGNLGAVARERSSFLQALEYLEQSVNTVQPLVDANPEKAQLRLLLSESWSWIGSISLDLGRLAEAESAYSAALVEAQAAYEISGSPTHQEEVADLLTFLANNHLLQGQSEEAAALLNEALLIRNTLVEHDDGNADWKRSRYKLLRKIAEVALVTNWQPRAKQQLAESLEGLERLIALDSSQTGYLQDLALSERLNALVLLQAGQVDSAVQEIEKASKRIQALGAKSAMNIVKVNAALIGETLGTVRAAAGDTDGARAAWSEAINTLPPAEDCDLLQKAIRSQLSGHLGMITDARKMSVELKAMGFADPRHPLPAAKL